MNLIPSKNPIALIGYYLGVFSLIPALGLLTALPAIVCGIIGVVKSRANPGVGGFGHAVTAIILGLIGPFVCVGVFFLFDYLTA